MADPQYLIDANLCINLLAGRSEAAARRLAAMRRRGSRHLGGRLCGIMIGAEQQGKVDRAMAFFAQIPVLPFDEAAARAYSRLPFKRGSYDRLIAAHALALGLTSSPATWATSRMFRA